MTAKKKGWTQITVRMPIVLKKEFEEFVKMKESDNSTMGRNAIREYLDRNQIKVG